MLLPYLVCSTSLTIECSTDKHIIWALPRSFYLFSPLFWTALTSFLYRNSTQWPPTTTTTLSTPPFQFSLVWTFVPGNSQYFTLTHKHRLVPSWPSLVLLGTAQFYSVPLGFTQYCLVLLSFLSFTEFAEWYYKILCDWSSASHCWLQVSYGWQDNGSSSKGISLVSSKWLCN